MVGANLEWPVRKERTADWKGMAGKRKLEGDRERRKEKLYIFFRIRRVIPFVRHWDSETWPVKKSFSTGSCSPSCERRLIGKHLGILNFQGFGKSSKYCGRFAIATYNRDGMKSCFQKFSSKIILKRVYKKKYIQFYSWPLNFNAFLMYSRVSLIWIIFRVLSDEKLYPLLFTS